MAAGPRALSCRGVLTPQEMQEVRGLQARDAISLAVFVDQERKGNACFFTKHPGIIAVAQSNRGQSNTFVTEGLLVFAQLRDVLAAKDSSVVPEKYQNGGLSGPQRAETNLLPIAIGKADLCEPGAEGFFHGFPVLSRAYRAVKCSASGLVLGLLTVFHHYLHSLATG